MKIPPLYFFNIAALFIFLVLTYAVVTGFIQPFDEFIARKLLLIQTAGFSSIMLLFSALGEIPSVIFLTIISMVVLYKRGSLEDMLLFGAAVFGAGILIQILKFEISRPRPLGSAIVLGTSSFPSGHVLISTVFACMLVYFIYRFGPRKNFWLISALVALFPAVIGFSRMYLNLHWLSDILAGFAMGFFWATLVIIIALTDKIEKGAS